MSPDSALLLLLLALVVALAVALADQIRQRNALCAWLTAPETHLLPDGRGAWHEVFSRLQALRKKERRQRAELSRALERFRLAAQALPNGIVLLDDRLRIEWLNQAAKDQFAIDPRHDIGTPIAQLVRASEFLSLLDRFRGSGARQEAIVPSRRNDSVFEVMLIPFTASGSLLVSADVTGRLRGEAGQRDFIANVSHELRTPLTVITGFLEQFNAAVPPTGETARSFHELMAAMAERMNRLVADLLTLSRLEKSDQPPHDESVDVPALLEALRAEALALSAGKHEIEIAAVSAGKLRGSADELRSAFGNLIANAVRYTPAGGKITLAWRLTDGAPTFSVTDTGIGIAPEHIPRLTERFYRVDKGRSTASGGTGLGLAIVKQVLARHGGHLQIESIPGRGSTFIARLPAARQELLS